MTDKVSWIIVGGVPQPIGGVTTYLRRLLHRDVRHIHRLLDYFPGEKEAMRPDCDAKLTRVRGAAGLVRWFWTHGHIVARRQVYFNFSTPRALLGVALIFKRADSHWCIMLHHGELRVSGPAMRWIARRVLARMDEIRYLSEAQLSFYRGLKLPNERLVKGTSYCEPADHVDSPVAAARFAEIRTTFEKVLVMSGFPRQMYNFQVAIDAVDALGRPDVALCLFIYGPGELRKSLRAQAERLPWLFLFDGEGETFFNTFLRQCDVFLRLTEVESFGISVWDADHWGRSIIASDVCVRPLRSRILSISDLRSGDSVSRALTDATKL